MDNIENRSKKFKVNRDRKYVFDDLEGLIYSEDLHNTTIREHMGYLCGILRLYKGKYEDILIQVETYSGDYDRDEEPHSEITFQGRRKETDEEYASRIKWEEDYERKLKELELKQQEKKKKDESEKLEKKIEKDKKEFERMKKEYNWS